MRPITVNGLSEDEQGTVNALLGQLDAHRARNLLRSEYYDGRRAMKAMSLVVPNHYNQLGLVLDWNAKAVDALARRCHLDGFTWADGDLDGIGLAEFADDNMLFSELAAARTLSLIHGVSFLVSTTGGEGEPLSLIHAKDALNGTGTWNHRTRSLDDFLSVGAWDKHEPTDLTLYLNGRTVRTVRMARTANGATVWDVVDRHEHRWGVPVEPVMYRPQGRPTGYSRITRTGMGIQDAAVRALTRMEGHMDVYSWPEMIILGADGGVMQDDQGQTLDAVRAMIGRIKGIPDDDKQVDPRLARAEVKQFPAQSPEPHLAQLNALAKLFARSAALPDTALAITDLANPVSEGAYDASQYELVAEAEGAQGDYDRPMIRSLRRGLMMRNGLAEMPASWRSINTAWRNPRFESRAQVADAGVKVAAAVPGLAETEVGLELMGLTPDQISRFQAEQRRAQGRAILDRIAPPTEG